MFLNAAALVRVAAFGAVCAACLAALPARGEVGLNLRPTVSVDAPLVTLGDLFEGAGELADTAVFRAPDPGTTGSVDADRVVRAARQHGLDGAGAGHVESVTVSRSSREIAAEDIGRQLANRLAEDGLVERAADTEVILRDIDGAVHIERTARAPLRVRDLSYDRRSGRFAAVLAVADSRIMASGIRVSGRAVEVVEVPVPQHAISRGGLIGRADIAMQRLPRSDLRAGTLRDPAEIVGMAARRGLRAGAPVSEDALMEPILVERNEAVTIRYRSGGLTLTVRGRAISAGGRGDVITVINSHSKRSIEAEVTGPGQVAVMAASPPVSAMLDAPH